MIDTLSITGVIFMLIGAGYLSVRLGVFGAGEMGTLGKFVVNLALPALIFNAVSSRPVGDIANAGYLAAMLGGSLVVFALGYAWSRCVSGASSVASTFRAMGMSCANSGFVGYPVLLMALPDIAATALAMNMIVENLVIIPLVLAIAERSRTGAGTGAQLALKIAGRLVRNPILLALVLGAGVSVSGLSLPMVIARPAEILANASAALSLAVIGGTLATLPVREMNLSAAPAVVAKLLLHPLAVALALAAAWVCGIGVEDERLAAAAVIMAATPAMGIYPILAQQYGEEKFASLAMFAMTALSFFTLSFVLAIMLP